jgi:hypothetical protein
MGKNPRRGLLTENQVLAFLKDIETGKVTLTCTDVETPAQIYAGDVHYDASNGWKLVIFNDCGQWDYIDRVSKGGRTADYQHISKFMPRVEAYDPSDDVAWDSYGIPGYLDNVGRDTPPKHLAVADDG